MDLLSLHFEINCGKAGIHSTPPHLRRLRKISTFNCTTQVEQFRQHQKLIAV